MFWQLASAANRALPAETAHRLAVSAMKFGFVPAAMQADAQMQIGCAGLDFANPLGLAAGFDKNAEAVKGALKLGFGHIEVGTITPLPQPGNPRPRVFRLTSDNAVINRYGFNSQGMEAAARRLERLRGSAQAGIVGVNIGANKASTDKFDDYYKTARRLAPVADYLTINISSPNTEGLRDLQHDDSLRRTIAAATQGMQDTGVTVPVFVKLAPDLSESQLAGSLEIALSAGISGFILTNTTIDRPDGLVSVHKGQSGGLSGAPLHDKSLFMLAQAASHLAHIGATDIPLIGVGGIGSAEQAYARMLAGASLVQIYTALALQGPQLVPRILSGLRQMAASEGASFAELTGQIRQGQRAYHHALHVARKLADSS